MLTRRKFVAMAAAVTIAQPSRAAQSTTVLDAINVFDAQAGAVRKNCRMVLSEDIIKKLGDAATVPIPQQAKVIDGRGGLIIPGLVSDHVHLGAYDGLVSGSQAQNLDVVRRQLDLYARFGVTTVTSMGTNSAILYGMKGEAEQPSFKGASFLTADRGIGVPKGAPPVSVSFDQLDRPSSPEEARRFVREAAARGADLIKLWLDDFQGAKLVKMDAAIYAAVIEEAHRNDLRVAAHIYYLDDAKAILRAGADLLGHGVRDRPVDQEFIDILAQSNAWYIPTLGVDEAFFRYAEDPSILDDKFLQAALHPDLLRQFQSMEWREKQLSSPARGQWHAAFENNLANTKRLVDLGLNVGFGTDSGAMPLRVPGYAEHRELELLVKAGLTSPQALILATTKASAALRLADRGTLEPGKRADFVIIASNDLQDIRGTRAIKSVWKAGVEVFSS